MVADTNRVIRRLRNELGRPARFYRDVTWNRVRARGEPIDFMIPNPRRVRLLPEGQIPELLFKVHFEHTELALVAAFVTRGMHVVDIGANVGLYSVFTGRAVGPRGHVWGFEPSSHVVGLLERNIALNGLENVSVHKLALAAQAGRLELRREANCRDGDRYLVGAATAEGAPAVGEGGDSESVEVTTLDAFRAQDGRLSAHVDFLKMDVEGGELAVFQGARETLRANRDLVMMFESNRHVCARAGHSQEEVFAVLEAEGFGLRAWDPTAWGWDSSRELLRTAGNVWAARDVTNLPLL